MKTILVRVRAVAISMAALLGILVMVSGWAYTFLNDTPIGALLGAVWGLLKGQP